MILQIILGFVIDKLWSPDRTSIPLWDKLHWWIGRVVFLIAIINLYLGIYKNASIDSAFSSLNFYVIVSIIVVLGTASLFAGQYAIGQVHHMKEHAGVSEKSLI